MNHLRHALADYLTIRRALGCKMDKAERLLGQFTAFAEDRGETHVRTETALAWANLPAGAAAIWASRRLAEVRIFARHLHALDGVSEVPPDDPLPARGRRATPYLYTSHEIADLMRATEILRGSHVQATYRTLIGLLAATGMRIGEAIGLYQGDFDDASAARRDRHRGDRALARATNRSKRPRSICTRICRSRKGHSRGQPRSPRDPAASGRQTNSSPSSKPSDYADPDTTDLRLFRRLQIYIGIIRASA